MTTPNYKTRDPKGWMGDMKRGAAMGRHTHAGDPDFAGRLFLRRVRLDLGGYDPNGTYFGIGLPLYWLADETSTIDRVFRAGTRKEAVAIARGRYPKARVRD